MIEFERNKPVDTQNLSEFFTRCGWSEPAGAVELEWAIAASDEWVVCRLEGELVGFARSCRLGPLDRVVFDALVDPRFVHSTLRAEMVALLAVGARRFERVIVFGQRQQVARSTNDRLGPPFIRTATPDMYTGMPRSTPKA